MWANSSGKFLITSKLPVLLHYFFLSQGITIPKPGLSASPNSYGFLKSATNPSFPPLAVSTSVSNLVKAIPPHFDDSNIKVRQSWNPIQHV